MVLDIFNFRDGQSLQPTGYLPSFVDSLIGKGLLDLEFLYGREPPLAAPSPRRRRLPTSTGNKDCRRHEISGQWSVVSGQWSEKR